MGGRYCAINSPWGSRGGQNRAIFFKFWYISKISMFILGKLFSQRNNLFHTQKRFFLARYRSPNGPHLLRMVEPIRSPENPGTTVVSFGHLTPWPENPGYHTQGWDNVRITHHGWTGRSRPHQNAEDEDHKCHDAITSDHHLERIDLNDWTNR